ncbi:hypothetical protein GQ53DRAFT_756052 [Thozetella sp. PMI_491]|nr:hypothetical protein GQ53DRAFT_756052 [Thozetella sp. PMI_491]
MRAESCPVRSRAARQISCGPCGRPPQPTDELFVYLLLVLPIAGPTYCWSYLLLVLPIAGPNHRFPPAPLSPSLPSSPTKPHGRVGLRSGWTVARDNVQPRGSLPSLSAPSPGNKLASLVSEV